MNNDSEHGPLWEYGTTILEKVKHRIRIEFFEGDGYQYLSAGIVDEEGFGEEFPAEQLSY